MHLSSDDARASKLDEPGYLLILFCGLVFWLTGIVELVSNLLDSQAPAFVGFTPPFFWIFSAVYALGFLAWLALFFVPAKWPKEALRYFQHGRWRPFLFLGSLLGTGWCVANLMKWVHLPALRLCLVFIVILLSAGFVLLDWKHDGKAQYWRRIVVLFAAAALLVEGVIQLLTVIGAIPGVIAQHGLFVPHGRVYQSGEGFGNGMANNHGWYYPDFRLEEGGRRVLLIGDSYIQALQIDKDRHLGVGLEKRINAQQTTGKLEVLACGMPGFGPGLYLDVPLMEYAISRFKPDEVIVFFELSSDFQNSLDSADTRLPFFVNAKDSTEIYPAAASLRHSIQHYILPGLEAGLSPYPDYQRSFLPVEVAASHYLTPKLFSRLLGNGDFAYAGVLNDHPGQRAAFQMPGFRGEIVLKEEITGYFTDIKSTGLSRVYGRTDFLFDKDRPEKARHAVKIATTFIEQFGDFLSGHSITFRLVTIPVFPRLFYETYEGRNWSPELGRYDLLLPEKALTAFASEIGIAMLPMGEYMLLNQLPVEEIKALYFLNGEGHFTPRGHEYFAEAVFQRFYAETRER